jgi:hypothetical protein
VFDIGDEYIGTCLECVYDKEKDDKLQRQVNYMIAKQLPVEGELNLLGAKGGWRVLRPRTDKGGNPMEIARKIWKTISGYDIS